MRGMLLLKTEETAAAKRPQVQWPCEEYADWRPRTGDYFSGMQLMIHLQL